MERPTFKTRALQVLGFVALAFILFSAFLGCIFTEGLLITIANHSDTSAPARAELYEAPQAGFTGPAPHLAPAAGLVIHTQ